MTKMKILATAAALAAFGSAAAAQELMVRDKLMMAVGASMGALGAMAKGEAPYDARVAQLGFTTMNAVALVIGDQYPEGSKQDVGKYYASAKVWDNRAGFDEAVAKFAADTSAAMEAKPADLDAFKAVFGKVAENCKGCHDDYRVKGAE